MIRKKEMMMTCRSLFAMIVLAIGISSCQDDPKPVNEEEVITTVTVVLTPAGGGVPRTLKFYDADGDGSIAPVTTVSGALLTGKTYTGVITLSDESRAVALDITSEIQAESQHHLFCFESSASNLTVIPTDTDSKGLPLGLTSSWTTTTDGTVNVKITLRHQFGTKTGTCPGTGETDVEVNFTVKIEQA